MIPCGKSIKKIIQNIQIFLEADPSHSYNGITTLGTIVTDSGSPGLPITIVHGGDSGNHQSTPTNQQNGGTTNNGGGASPDSSLIVLQPSSTATYSSMLPSFSHYATGKSCNLSDGSGTSDI